MSREIPGYKLLRFLGGGSLFEVWEARPVDDIIPVAIKFLRPEALESPSALTLLKREARAGTLLRHPRLADPQFPRHFPHRLPVGKVQHQCPPLGR